MRLKATKRLLNLASAVSLCAAGAVGYWGLRPIPSTEPNELAGHSLADDPILSVHLEGKTRTNSPAPTSRVAAVSATSVAMNWGRAWRRPLFDPPPPAPVVVRKPPPQPIRARLLATTIESENSTAMVRLASAQVVFLKVGESLGGEEPSTQIVKIEAGSVLVRRGGEELRLSVDGAKGK
jgi:hypothetical protein